MDRQWNIAQLEKYLAMTKDRLASPVPPKHKLREKEYRDFLRKEVKLVTARLQELRNPA